MSYIFRLVPHIHSGQLLTRLPVCSYGVVLLEIITSFKQERGRYDKPRYVLAVKSVFPDCGQMVDFAHAHEHSSFLAAAVPAMRELRMHDALVVYSCKPAMLVCMDIAWYASNSRALGQQHMMLPWRANAILPILPSCDVQAVHVVYVLICMWYIG